jgi:hypothetical protein
MVTVLNGHPLDRFENRFHFIGRSGGNARAFVCPRRRRALRFGCNAE